MPKLTLADLAGACEAQRRMFNYEWPDGCPVTLKSYRRACELGLHVGWLVAHCGNKRALDAYHRATEAAALRRDCKIKAAAARHTNGIGSCGPNAAAARLRHAQAYASACTRAWRQYCNSRVPAIVALVKQILTDRTKKGRKHVR